MIARRFRRRIGAVGIVAGSLLEKLRPVSIAAFRRSRRRERRFDALGVGQFQRSVHLVGRYVVEPLAVVTLGQRFPILFGGLKQRERAHHVRASESERILYRAVDMAFGSEMDNAVDLVRPDDTPHLVEIGYIGLDEGVIGSVFDILEVGEVAGIGQFIEVDYTIVGIFIDEQTDDMAADKAGTARDENITPHFLSGF